MSKQKIVSIEIELKNYEPIKFTMDEARELYEQLHGLFGEKEQHNHYHSHYDRWWNRPYYTWYGASSTTPTNAVSSTSISSPDDLIGKAVASNNTDMMVTYSASA